MFSGKNFIRILIVRTKRRVARLIQKGKDEKAITFKGYLNSRRHLRTKYPSSNAILLIHGLGGSKKDWDPFIERLIKHELHKSWHIHCWGYPSATFQSFTDHPNPDIEFIADGLRTHIKSRMGKYENIVLVAHSLGGIITRKYLLEEIKLERLPKVSTLLLIGTPNNGSHLASLAKYFNRNNKVIYQLLPYSDFLKSLNRDWESSKVESYINTKYLVGGMDEVVTSESVIDSFGLEKVGAFPFKNHSNLIIPEKNEEDPVIQFLLSELEITNRLTVFDDEFPSIDQLLIPFEVAFNRIDKQVNSNLNNGIVLSRSAEGSNDLESFNSEKLTTSLIELGIPLRISISVLRSVANIIINFEYNAKNSLSTRDLRTIVSKSIRGLSVYGVDINSVKKWRNNYAMRYGNPDSRLMIIKDNGEECVLDYELIIDVFIPKLLKETVNYDESIDEKNIDRKNGEKNKFVSHSVQKNMAEELFGVLNTMNLYTLNFQTAYNIFHSLAIEPPHPWIITESSKDRTLNYDLERSKFWINTLNDINDQIPESGLIHSIHESIHHTCSYILGYYNCFLGCGELAPLIQIRKHLDQDSINPFPNSNIVKLKADVEKSDLSYFDLLRNISRITKNIKNIKVRNSHLQKWIDELNVLYDFAINLKR